MVVSRASVLSAGFGRTVLRRAGPATRSRTWRQVGRRNYASGHGEQQSSELPWIIGSAAVTIPAAGWLWSQGPKKGDHGHGHGGHGEEHKEESEEKEEEEPEQPEEESKDEPEEKSDDQAEDKAEDKTEEKDEGEDKEEKSEDAGDSSEEEKSEDSSDEGSSEDDQYEKPGPNAPKQINWHSGMNKGPGEGQKGERKPTERKGEKDAQGDFSGAKHPYINDPEKSKKGVGVTETARIHGTVDSRTGARGVGSTGTGSS